MMLERLKALLRPPVLADPQAQIIGQLLHVLLLAVIGLLFSTLLLAFLLPAYRLANAATALVFGACLFLWYRLRRGSVLWVGNVFPLVAWVGAIGAVLDAGTIRTAAASTFLLTVILAGLLGTFRTIAFYAILSGVTLTVLLAAETAGWLVTPAVQMPDAVNPLFTYLRLIIATAVMLALVNRLIRGVLDRATRNEQQLLERTQQMQTIQDSLSGQVAERTASLQAALQQAEAARQVVEAQAWLSGQVALLDEVLRGQQEPVALAQRIISHLCQTLNAPVGAFFSRQGDTFYMLASYAYALRKNGAPNFHLGEGLIGQAALERQPISIRRIPPNYMPVLSGLAEVTPRLLIALPVMGEGQAIGVIELGLLAEPTAIEHEYLTRSAQIIGMVFRMTAERAQAAARPPDILSLPVRPGPDQIN